MITPLLNPEQSIKDLQTWHDFLYQVNPGNFCLHTWKNGDTELNPEIMDGSCGTVACAAGWATAIPEFKERGLHLEIEPQSSKQTVCFDGHNDVQAMKRFFQVNYTDMHEITAPVMYLDRQITIEDVQERIRTLIREIMETHPPEFSPTNVGTERT